MEIKKIYLDMDGVLADFENGVRRFCGMEPLMQEKEGQNDAEDIMWEKIRDTEHFYDRLELLPGAAQMFMLLHEAYKDRLEILTGIPRPRRGIKGADEDKRKWVRRMLSEDILVNVVFRAQKQEFCTGSDSILIDDLKINIQEWEEAGGTGIWHTSGEETLRILWEKGIL